MGTPATCTFKHGTDFLCNIYVNSGGYPDDFGKDLVSFMSQYKIVDGLQDGGNFKVANGFPCLAALVIAHFKKDQPGGFYMVPEDDIENYHYEVSIGDADEIHLALTEGGEITFKGKLPSYESFLESC